MSESKNEESPDGENSAVTGSAVISKPSDSSLTAVAEMQTALNALEKVADVEHARIDMRNQRTEVIRYGLDIQDAKDQREYDYHIKLLESSDAKDREDRKIGERLFTFLLVVGVLMIGSLLAGAFFGGDSQRESAITIIKFCFTGLGGYGVLRMVERIFRRFFR